MALQYVGLNEINGSLVVLDHVKGASYATDFNALSIS